jgi:hypothetical protein
VSDLGPYIGQRALEPRLDTRRRAPGAGAIKMAFLDVLRATADGAKIQRRAEAKKFRYEFVKFSKTHTDQVIVAPSNGKMRWEEP